LIINKGKPLLVRLIQD